MTPADHAELAEHVGPLAPYGCQALAEAGADLSAILLHDDPGPALPPLAPEASGDEACAAVSPDGRWGCVADPGHLGDHVPYGAADTEAELRALTWPQDGGSL